MTNKKYSIIKEAIEEDYKSDEEEENRRQQ